MAKAFARRIGPTGPGDRRDPSHQERVRRVGFRSNWVRSNWVRAGWVRAVGVIALALVLGGADDDGVQITGQILYDARGGKPPKPAVADIVRVYAHNPAYMYLRASGMRETSGEGKRLFGEAQADTNRALAEVARARQVNVITVPGGVSGAPARDVTNEVIDRLPVYHVHGAVHIGRAAGAKQIAEIDSHAVLAVIPAWQEARGLDERDARFHLLRHRYMAELNRVMQVAARGGNHDVIVEKGGVTSRLGPVPDVTQAAVRAVDR